MAMDGRTAMSSASVLVAGAVTLVLAACSGGRSDEATGASEPGTGTGSRGETTSSSDGSSGTTGRGTEDADASTGGETSGTTAPPVDDDDDLLFVPAGLPNTHREVLGEVWLELVAFTLVQGQAGPELYAAIENTGDTPACYGGMTTYFVDAADQLVATWRTSLVSRAFYLLDDGTGVILPCVAPGEIAMTYSRELPDTIVIEELAYLEHEFPIFVLNDLVPVEVPAVSDVETVPSGHGGTYTGTLTNEYDGTVSDPAVLVFPVNRVGRPLGVATSTEPIELPPGGTWTFETTPVSRLGADHVVYPAVTFPSPE